MDAQTQTDLAHQMLDERAIGCFLTAVARMVGANPHPNGPTIRLTATPLNSDRVFPPVDIDVTSLWELAERANARAINPAPAAKPATVPDPAPGPAGKASLRLVGGAK